MAYHLFISHSWSHSDAYERLIQLLRADPWFPFVDHSIPKDDPVHTSSPVVLSMAIQHEILSCHVVLVLAGVYATYSSWIQEEIRQAKHGVVPPRPVIGIKPFGNTQVSSVVGDNADVIVGWRTQSVVDAIRSLIG